jgi:hypothetical protein
MKKEQKLEQQPNSDSTADNSQVNPTCPKPIVSSIPILDLSMSESLREQINLLDYLHKEIGSYGHKLLGISPKELGRSGCC